MRTILFLALAGCAGEGTGRCVPGQSAPCACSDGKSGAQLCRDDGTFEACECASGNPNHSPDLASGAPDLGQSSGAKIVFVTSTAYLPTAIATVCSDSAQAAGLGSNFKPWLSSRWSTGDNDAIDAIEGNGPWKLVTGTVAFANHGQLATQPNVPINVTEHGTTLAADEAVWTGTAVGGRSASWTCDNWDDASGTVLGQGGNPHRTDTWTEAGVPRCSERLHVYCFEQ